MLRPPAALDALVAALKRLPGVGPRTAQRYAYHLQQNDREAAEAIAGALMDATARIRHCERCNTFTELEVCETCVSTRRDATKLCVVETPADQVTMDQTLAFDGLYFVLMGRLSPLDGIGPRDIGLDVLARRATDGTVREVVVATNFTNEGEATAHYIGEMLRDRGVKVSRIARGIPVGGELEYVDIGTIAQAMVERRPV